MTWINLQKKNMAKISSGLAVVEGRNWERPMFSNGLTTAAAVYEI